MKKIFLLLCLSAIIFSSCLTTSNNAVAEKVDTETPAAATYQGLKRTVAIARFTNETQYAKGAFYDKDSDPLGQQAVDILSTKLAASGKFILFERSDLDKVTEELKLGNSNYQKVGADFIIVGSITEYGRKNTGETGLLSREKHQIVEAGVSVRLIDVSTAQIIYSEEGKGSAETTSSTVMGLGGQAGFDATLSDKAISAAISQLVENIINNCMDKPWKSYFLSYDSDAIIISGGKSQGLTSGKTLSVYTRGKKVKNPQSGLTIELPGQKQAMIKVLTTGGDTVESEYSIVEFTSGDIDSTKLESYIIQEEK